MKLFKQLACAIFAALVLAACGSATEVGNPIADIPTRTVTGVIDTATVSADMDALKELSSKEDISTVDPAELTVTAEAAPLDIETAPVQHDGSFTITVQTRKSYQWSIYLGALKVGDFSFVQAGGISRSNRLEIDSEGDPIDLGMVRYQGGEFVPENEPEEQEGNPGGGGGDGGDGNGPA